MGEKEKFVSPMITQLHRLVAIILVTISPARLAVAPPVAIPVQSHAQVAADQVPYKITLDTADAGAIKLIAEPRPDFDTEVLMPLQAAQAKAKAEAAAKARTLAKPRPVAPSNMEEALAQLRYCESGGDYTKNTGNGYFGAYQYAISSWGNYGGYARADLAPAHVQDQKVREHVAARGWGAWPACAAKLGLR